MRHKSLIKWQVLHLLILYSLMVWNFDKWAKSQQLKYEIQNFLRISVMLVLLLENGLKNYLLENK